MCLLHLMRMLRALPAESQTRKTRGPGAPASYLQIRSLAAWPLLCLRGQRPLRGPGWKADRTGLVVLRALQSMELIALAPTERAWENHMLVEIGGLLAAGL